MKQTIFATVMAATLLGCTSPEMARRAEIEKVEAQVRDEIRRLVDNEKFAEACNYQYPRCGKQHLDLAADRARQFQVRNVVYPKWVEWHDRRLADRVSQMVTERKFGEAREYIWQYGSTGVAEVDAQVDAIRYRLLAERVNVVELDFMQKDLCATYEAAVKVNTVAALVEAKKKIVAYPAVRTYSSALDGSLDRVRDALVSVNVPEGRLIPILARTRNMISDCFADRKSTVKTEEKAGPDLHDSRSRLTEFQSDLMKYGCNAQQAESVADAFAKDVKPLLDEAIRKAKGRPNVVALGTASINERAEKIRKGLIDRIDTHVMEMLTKKALEEVKADLSKAQPDFASIRVRLLTPQSVGDAQLDVQYLALRIGLLNAYVNPTQCAHMIATMDGIVAEAKKNASNGAKLFAAYESLCNMKLVDDGSSYESVKHCLVQIGNIMKQLNISNITAEEYVQRKTVELVAELDDRNETFVDRTERDTRPLAERLNQYESELRRHFEASDGNYSAKSKGTIWNDVQGMLKNGTASMTTRKLKERTDAHLMSCRRTLLPMLRKVKADDARRKAEELAAEEREEQARERRAKLGKINFDWQVQMALGRIDVAEGHDPWGNDGMNALLGEYARLNRSCDRAAQQGEKDPLMKIIDNDPDAYLTLLSCGAYLGQDSEVDSLIGCSEGKNLNVAPSMDPRKRTLLLMAIQYSRVSILEKLIDADSGVDMSVSDADGNGVAHYVAECGNTDMLTSLHDRIDVCQTNKTGETALFVAVRKDNGKMVRAIVTVASNKIDRAAGGVAYVDLPNAVGLTPVSVACSNGCLSALQELASLNAAYGERDLVVAAGADQCAIARWLVEHDVNVNAPGVMSAVPSGSQTERFLISQGGIRVARGGAQEKKETSAVPGKVKYFLCEVPSGPFAADEDAKAERTKGTGK